MNGKSWDKRWKLRLKHDRSVGPDAMAYGTLTEAVVVPIKRDPWSTTPRVRL